jgi:hypothetical protein
MIIGRSSTKCSFFMPIWNPRWPPLQEIDNIGPYWKMFKCLLLKNEHSCTVRLQSDLCFETFFP